jgi:hypothetical protein
VRVGTSGSVSAVIVHFRTPEETLAAARAALRTAPETEVLVVDDVSNDAILERLSREVPAARLDSPHLPHDPPSRAS